MRLAELGTVHLHRVGSGIREADNVLAIRDSVYPSVDAAQRIAMLLQLPREPWMQDWPIEVTDADRLDEFVCLLQTKQLNVDERFTATRRRVKADLELPMKDVYVEFIQGLIGGRLVVA